MIIMMMIINLIYIAQFDTKIILTVLDTAIQHIQMHYMHICMVCLLAACITSQQHASVSHGRTYLDKFMCCHTKIEAADQTFYLTQSQYIDTGLTNPSADPTVPGAWQGCHWNVNI